MFVRGETQSTAVDDAMKNQSVANPDEIDIDNEDDEDEMDDDQFLAYFDDVVSHINLLGGFELPYAHELEKANPTDFLTKPYPSIKKEIKDKDGSIQSETWVMQTATVRTMILPYLRKIVSDNDSDIDNAAIAERKFGEGLGYFLAGISDVPSYYIGTDLTVSIDDQDTKPEFMVYETVGR